MKSIKRIAAVHDISGFGKASLTVVIPILSTMGIQVCPVPTAVLSSISEFPRTKMVDLTDYLDDFILHWQQLSLKFDAVYSGFLGSSRQVIIVKELIRKTAAENALIIIDPVMGDNGLLYPVFDDSIIRSQQELITHAQVITPNVTEAAFLLDENPAQKLDKEKIVNWLQRLAAIGPEIVIITSVPDYSAQDFTSVFAFDKKRDEYWKLSCRYLPGNFPGTGDTFASIITGSLLQKDSLPMVISRAAGFVYKAIEFSLDYIKDRREGIFLEPVLAELHNPSANFTTRKLDI